MNSVRSRLLIIALVLAIAGSAAGLYQLFMLRFSAGDLFPDGSSLNSDPRGSMALYQALERTGQAHVRRNYRPLTSLQDTGSTLLLLNIDPRQLTTASRQDTIQLEQFAAAGNRVVIAFKPITSASASMPAKTDTGQRSTSAWGLTPDLLPADPGTPDRPDLEATLQATDSGLPAQSRFRSRLTLQPPPSGWQIIYTIQDNPVLLERSIGNGSLVLVTDASLMSNQSLKDERQTALLAWLLADSRAIIFDEFHLGVTEQSGIMVLIRRFGLLPLLAALLVLAGLFIWRASIPLSPITPESDGTPADLNHLDSFSGLVNLLRRNIPPGQLLSVCSQEWQRSFGHELKHDQQLRKAFHELTKQTGDPLKGYQLIARLRAERNRR